MSRQDEARKALKALEKNPKHTTHTPEAEDQTRNDNIDDPKFHDKTPARNPHKDDPNIDASWHKDKDGNWYREGDDE